MTKDLMMFVALSTRSVRTLLNDGDNNEDKKGTFYWQVDGVQESCVGVNKQRRLVVNMQTLDNDTDSKVKEREFHSQVDNGVKKGGSDT